MTTILKAAGSLILFLASPLAWVLLSGDGDDASAETCRERARRADDRRDFGRLLARHDATSAATAAYLAARGVR